MLTCLCLAAHAPGYMSTIEPPIWCMQLHIISIVWYTDLHSSILASATSFTRSWGAGGYHCLETLLWQALNHVRSNYPPHQRSRALNSLELLGDDCLVSSARHVTSWSCFVCMYTCTVCTINYIEGKGNCMGALPLVQICL